MSEPTEGRSSGRVLVALRAADDSGELLETAARLAARLHAELVGVFAPDRELESALGRPGTRLIARSGVELSVDAGQLRRVRRVLAAEAQALLAATAERHRAPWTFRAVESYSTTTVLGELGSGDVLAFRRRPRQRGGTTHGRPILVLHAGSEGTLALGDQLAAITGRPLAVIVTAEHAEALGRLEADALAWLESRRRERRVERLEPATVATMAELLRRMRPAMAVVDRRMLAAGWDDAAWDELEHAAAEAICTLFARH